MTVSYAQMKRWLTSWKAVRNSKKHKLTSLSIVHDPIYCVYSPLQISPSTKQAMLSVMQCKVFVVMSCEVVSDASLKHLKGDAGALF